MCIIWGFFIRHFRLLKTSKFKVIAQLENYQKFHLLMNGKI